MWSRPTYPDADTERDGFRFRGGHPALDLTATLLGRLKQERRELLGTPSDLARWLVASGLADETPECDERSLATAVALRESIYELLVARIRRAAPPVTARKTANEIARRASAHVQLSPRGEARLEGDASELLAEIARAAILLIGGESGARVRKCEAEGCSMFFLDKSRSGARRWCSMKACGNRFKVAEFRRRQTDR